jgi:hypothetical protein
VSSFKYVTSSKVKRGHWLCIKRFLWMSWCEKLRLVWNSCPHVCPSRRGVAALQLATFGRTGGGGFPDNGVQTDDDTMPVGDHALLALVGLPDRLMLVEASEDWLPEDLNWLTQSLGEKDDAFELPWKDRCVPISVAGGDNLPSSSESNEGVVAERVDGADGVAWALRLAAPWLELWHEAMLGFSLSGLYSLAAREECLVVDEVDGGLHGLVWGAGWGVIARDDGSRTWNPDPDEDDFKWASKATADAELLICGVSGAALEPVLGFSFGPWTPAFKTCFFEVGGGTADVGVAATLGVKLPLLGEKDVVRETFAWTSCTFASFSVEQCKCSSAGFFALIPDTLAEFDVMFWIKSSRGLEGQSSFVVKADMDRVVETEPLPRAGRFE